MSLEPKKTGGPIAKFWDSPEIIASLEGVKGWLGKNAKRHIASDPPTAKSLAQLVSQLIQFQEDNLGKAAKDPPFARLPVGVGALGNLASLTCAHCVLLADAPLLQLRA